MDATAKVVDIRKDDYDVYIGRGKGSPWGNPFVIGRDGTREEVIDKYHGWITLRGGGGTHLLGRIGELEGMRLGCFCAPKGGARARDKFVCHGQILLQILEIHQMAQRRRNRQQKEDYVSTEQATGQRTGMGQARADLWSAPADLRCITTNGQTRADGAAVMGRGCAREATRLIGGIEYKLGGLLRKYGNRPFRLCRYNGADLASFPVKHHWKETADPALIERSAHQLVQMADRFGYRNVLIPRPGCGNGGLDWQSRVRPILAAILDERFTILSK